MVFKFASVNIKILCKDRTFCKLSVLAKSWNYLISSNIFLSDDTKAVLPYHVKYKTGLRKRRKNMAVGYMWRIGLM